MTLDSLYQRLSGLCVRSEQCAFDIMEKLRRLDPEREAVANREAFIDRLTEEGFLSPERYCRAFAHDKFRFSQWGPKKIRYHLSMKQLPAACIDEALAALPEEDVAALREKLLHKKCPNFEKADYKTRQKALASLAAKGF